MNKLKAFLSEYPRSIQPSINISNIICIYYITTLTIRNIRNLLSDKSNIIIEVGLYFLALAIIGVNYWFMKKDIDPQSIWPKRKMDLTNFVFILAVCAFNSVISSILICIVREICAIQDTTLPGTVADVGITPDIIINVVIISPIMEELMFRGAGLSLFRKCDNKLEAIIFTSVLFGLAHGTYSQFIDSTLGGLIYGFVAIEFGVIYSIALHMLNNGLVYVTYFLNIQSFLVLFYLALIFWLLLSSKEVIKYIKYHMNSERKFSLKKMSMYFLNPTILVLCILWIIWIVESI